MGDVTRGHAAVAVVGAVALVHAANLHGTVVGNCIVDKPQYFSFEGLRFRVFALVIREVLSG